MLAERAAGQAVTADPLRPLRWAAPEPGAAPRQLLVHDLAQDGSGPTYSFDEVLRLKPLWLLAALFVIVIAVVARLRGVLAVVGLVFGGLVLVRFMLPALLSGSNGLAVSLVGSALIMFVVLPLAHGPSIRTGAEPS